MVDIPRAWADIDTAWLQRYLQEHDLAGDYDLDDELLGAQVSWILSEEQWRALRQAWEACPGQAGEAEGAARTPATEARNAGPSPRASAPGLMQTESPSGVVPAEGGSALDEDEDSGLCAEADRHPQEGQRLRELAQRALTDWHAFKALFRDSPQSADMAIWETLADSPLVLLQRAQAWIQQQGPEAGGPNRQSEQEFEDEVGRAQNSIAGYLMYCRKHRLAPSFEHFLALIPVMRTGHAQDAVQEAWRREVEARQRSQRRR